MALSFREAQIDQGYVRFAGVELSNCFNTVCSFPNNAETLREPQQSDETLTYDMMIFDDQDFDRIVSHDSSGSVH